MPGVTPGATRRLVCVVMGVSGTGKSTVASALAQALALPVFDGDDLHAAASVAKMKSGQALSDDDRWPWLDRIGALLADSAQHPGGLVVSCSALKRAYRERLRQRFRGCSKASPRARTAPNAPPAATALCFAFLDGTPELIQARLQQRQGHYMPATLLASQLQTLQRPGADEPDVLHLDIAASVPQLVQQVRVALNRA